MVFSSVPLYLDQPNWHQLQQPNHQEVCGGENSQFQPPPPPQVGVGCGGGGSIRPGSMVDRARMAKIPQPEAGLKCPRCESTNTKFCYFNNYNLTQPRHFCKTCRRYWTRGGALRNVPVGGGCRRNKKIKNSSSSKSQVTADQKAVVGLKSTSPSPSPSSCNNNTDMPSSHFTQLPFMDSALQNLGQYGGGGGNLGIISGGFQAQMAATGGAGLTSLGFQISGGGGGADQWRLPFLTGLETPGIFYPHHQSEVVQNRSSGQVETVAPLGGGGSGVALVAAPVQMEEKNRGGLNLSRQFMGIFENNNNNNNQYLGGNTWTEISGMNSS
ncbi:unnamed protein product [Camellia sinensis]